MQECELYFFQEISRNKFEDVTIPPIRSMCLNIIKNLVNF